MQHVVITGGAGFVGSHLCEAFLSQGKAVTAVDNLVTGRLENLQGFLSHPRFSFVQRDVSLPFSEEDLPLVQKWGLWGVLHFACPASPVDFERLPFEILQVDSLGTFQTIDLALRFQARYLLASTSEVYGDPLVHPQPETYWGNVSSVGPRACYDEAKRFAEACVSSAIRWKRLKGGIVRIFNTYGPRMRLRDGRIVPELCRQILAQEPLTIHGSGMQTRSFCFVTDLVAGILKVFESSYQIPINLGNPIERTVLEFAQILQRLVQSKNQSIHHLAARPDDPKRRCPDISFAKTHLDWEPSVDLEEGLRLTLESFKKDLNREKKAGQWT